MNTTIKCGIELPRIKTNWW